MLPLDTTGEAVREVYDLVAELRRELDARCLELHREIARLRQRVLDLEREGGEA